MIHTAGSWGKALFRFKPFSASPNNHSDGKGSSTYTEFVFKPSAIQPCSIAEPILPQPSKTNPFSDTVSKAIKSSLLFSPDYA